MLKRDVSRERGSRKTRNWNAIGASKLTTLMSSLRKQNTRVWIKDGPRTNTMLPWLGRNARKTCNWLPFLHFCREQVHLVVQFTRLLVHCTLTWFSLGSTDGLGRPATSLRHQGNLTYFLDGVKEGRPWNQPGCKSQHACIPAMRLWGSCLTFLSLSFHNCKTIIIFIACRAAVKLNEAKEVKHLAVSGPGFHCCKLLSLPSQRCFCPGSVLKQACLVLKIACSVFVSFFSQFSCRSYLSLSPNPVSYDNVSLKF